MATIFGLKRGDHLNNGAMILAIHDDKVLCYWDAKDEFVTWNVDAKGNAESGNYFQALEPAIADFKQRSEAVNV